MGQPSTLCPLRNRSGSLGAFDQKEQDVGGIERGAQHDLVDHFAASDAARNVAPAPLGIHDQRKTVAGDQIGLLQGAAQCRIAAHLGDMLNVGRYINMRIATAVQQPGANNPRGSDDVGVVERQPECGTRPKPIHRVGPFAGRKEYAHGRPLAELANPSQAEIDRP